MIPRLIALAALLLAVLGLSSLTRDSARGSSRTGRAWESPAAAPVPGVIVVLAADRPAIAVQVLGRVSDAATGAALVDVQVSVPGSSLRAASRADGSYGIVMPDGWAGREVSLRFERIGFAPVSHKLVLASGDNRLDAAMQTQVLTRADSVAGGRGKGTPIANANVAPRAMQEFRASDFTGEGVSGGRAVAPALNPAGLPVDREGYAHMAENRLRSATDRA